MNAKEGMRPWAATPDAHGAKVVPSYMRLPLPTLNAERARLEHVGLRATVLDGVLYVGPGGEVAPPEPTVPLHTVEQVVDRGSRYATRTRVPGGWVYETSIWPNGGPLAALTSTFVPDPR